MSHDGLCGIGPGGGGSASGRTGHAGDQGCERRHGAHGGAYVYDDAAAGTARGSGRRPMRWKPRQKRPWRRIRTIKRLWRTGTRSSFPMCRSRFITLRNMTTDARRRQRFDPLKPTSLLYKKTADGYKLVGAMYTDRVSASEDELNERIPLSVAHWHQHINFCKAPLGEGAAYFGPDARVWAAGLDHDERSVRCGGWSVSPACVRVDGPCLSLRDRPHESLVDGR